MRRPVIRIARHHLEHLALAGHPGDRAEAPAHARRLDRLAHHRDVAGGLEGVVGAEAVGHLEDLVDACRGRRRACRWRPAARACSSRSSDRSMAMIRSAPASRAARHGAEADQAGAEDHAGRAGLDLGDVERGADARGGAAGERADHVERRLGVHLGERDLRHHGGLGEGARAHEVADVVAVRWRRVRAVGEVALVLLLADGEAEVRLVGDGSGCTRGTGARRASRRDRRARRWSRPRRPSSTTPAPSWPSTVGRVAGRVGAAGRVEVGVTDAAGREPHEHLARPRPVELDVLDDERLGELLENGGADLHGAEP